MKPLSGKTRHGETPCLTETLMQHETSPQAGLSRLQHRPHEQLSIGECDERQADTQAEEPGAVYRPRGPPCRHLGSELRTTDSSLPRLRRSCCTRLLLHAMRKRQTLTPFQHRAGRNPGRGFDMSQLAKVEPQEPAAASENTAMVSMFERMASDPNVDVDKLERLMQMRERAIERQAKADFDAAMADLQPELPTIGERGNAAGRYTYALWEDINTAIKPALQKHGFALSF